MWMVLPANAFAAIGAFRVASSITRHVSSCAVRPQCVGTHIALIALCKRSHKLAIAIFSMVDHLFCEIGGIALVVTVD